jgi:hypothetical protein
MPKKQLLTAIRLTAVKKPTKDTLFLNRTKKFSHQFISRRFTLQASFWLDFDGEMVVATIYDVGVP